MHYVKMNGCGNDFTIFDMRATGAAPFSAIQAKAVADRKRGPGCDQVIAIEPSRRADAFMRIWNADGEEVGACGNGARCAAWLLMEEGGACKLIETAAGVLRAERRGAHQVMIDFGPPRLGWSEIPIVREMDTVRLDYAAEVDGWRVEAPGAVNMGNPHAVFFVQGVEDLPIAALGPRIERDPFFPEGVNAGFAEVQGRDAIRLRVWERGAGLTKACGTGACAAVVAAHRAGLADREARVTADGGQLHVAWSAADDHVRMTGPVEFEGEGEFEVA
jgi:diaminopimelate epimerase